MTATLQTTSVEGLVCLVVETPTLKLAVLPDVGAKVISLVHQASGHEFLWRHPGRALQRPAYGAPYDHYDLSGWDECFPTIGPVVYPADPWQGVAVPDHGELWALPWSWEFTGDRLHMWVNSVRFAYTFHRTFDFTQAGTVAITYQVTNPTPFGLQALWSMHPFLNVTPTSRVLLPEGVRVRIEISQNERIGSFLNERPWPLVVDRTGNTVDLSLMGPPGQPYVEKLFSTPLPAGWSALYDEADEHFLAFTFDPASVPFMGVCQLRGGWPEDVPSYSTILEPCNGWPDRLDLAMSRGASVEIPANGERTWQVTLHVGQGKGALDALLTMDDGRPTTV